MNFSRDDERVKLVVFEDMSGDGDSGTEYEACNDRLKEWAIDKGKNGFCGFIFISYTKTSQTKATKLGPFTRLINYLQTIRIHAFLKHLLPYSLFRAFCTLQRSK